MRALNTSDDSMAQRDWARQFSPVPSGEQGARRSGRLSPVNLAISLSREYLLGELRPWLESDCVGVSIRPGADAQMANECLPDMLSQSLNEFGETILCGYFAITNRFEMHRKAGAIDRLRDTGDMSALYVVSPSGVLVPEQLPVGVNLIVHTYFGSFIRLIFDVTRRRHVAHAGMKNLHRMAESCL